MKSTSFYMAAYIHCIYIRITNSTHANQQDDCACSRATSLEIRGDVLVIAKVMSF